VLVAAFLVFISREELAIQANSRLLTTIDHYTICHRHQFGEKEGSYFLLLIYIVAKCC